VGNTTRSLYSPAARGTSAVCGRADDCADVGEIVVDSAADCDLPPSDLAGRGAPGDACTRASDCAPLASCYRRFCVGESYARVSTTWSARSDFDLHVKLPDGRVLYEQTRAIDRVGRLDAEQRADTAAEHFIESVVLASTAPSGTYEAWVENYGGQAAGDAEIEVLVAGQRRLLRTLAVPPAAEGKSPSVTFTLP
jgi:hypothetical protein